MTEPFESDHARGPMNMAVSDFRRAQLHRSSSSNLEGTAEPLRYAVGYLRHILRRASRTWLRGTAPIVGSVDKRWAGDLLDDFEEIESL